MRPGVSVDLSLADLERCAKRPSGGPSPLIRKSPVRIKPTESARLCCAGARRVSMTRPTVHGVGLYPSIAPSVSFDRIQMRRRRILRRRGCQMPTVKASSPMWRRAPRTLTARTGVRSSVRHSGMRGPAIHCCRSIAFFLFDRYGAYGTAAGAEGSKADYE